MENEFKRIVEVNGVKVEVDLRTAKRVDSFKVGDPVKVLIKNYSDYKSHFGTIVGFDEFKSLPTIVVAYLDAERWSEQPLRFVYINEKTVDVEICCHERHDLSLNKADILTQFDREVNKLEQQIRDLARKRTYFLEMFGKHFHDSSEQVTA